MSLISVYRRRLAVRHSADLSVIASETCEVVDDYNYLDCPTCNFDFINSGLNKGPGSGRYITFTLDTPVPLTPNTYYGFDVGGGHVEGMSAITGR